MESILILQHKILSANKRATLITTKRFLFTKWLYKVHLCTFWILVTSITISKTKLGLQVLILTRKM